MSIMKFISSTLQVLLFRSHLEPYDGFLSKLNDLKPGTGYRE